MGRYLTSTLNYSTTNVVTGVSVTAKANERIIFTAGSITVTLPATPTVEDTVSDEPQTNEDVSLDQISESEEQVTETNSDETETN